MKERFIIAAGYSVPADIPTVTISGADVTAPTVTVAPRYKYTISGACGVAGATVTLDTGERTTSTGSTGTFTLPAVSNGTYTVTVTKTGYTFLPTTQSVTVQSANVTGINFAATTVKISVTITGEAKAGVTVSCTGQSDATTDADGYCEFAGLANGSYTVSYAKTGCAISPASSSVTIAGVSQSVTGITATQNDVSGTITGTVVTGVTVTLGSFGSMVTGAGGTFLFQAVPNDTYTLTAELDGYQFTNNNQSIVVDDDDEVATTMVCSAVKLDGYVLDGSDQPIEGVTITLTGGSTAETNVDGYWSFSPILDGEYTITPTKTGLVFTPTARDIIIDGESYTMGNFVGGSALPSTGLVGYWPLTDGSAADQSGNSHDMSITGALTANMTDPSGTENKVHAFNGSEGVYHADHADFDFSTDAFSISLWVCTTSGGAITAGPGSLVIKNAYTGVSPAGQYLWDLTIDARATQKWWKFYNDAAIPASQPVGIADMSSAGVGTGVWKHIVFTRSAAGATYLYFHNAKIGPLTACAGSFSNDKALGIGLANGASDSYGWKGGICHVRIYKGYVLTDEDVAALFNAKA
jgi:hypothetical protein